MRSTPHIHLLTVTSLLGLSACGIQRTTPDPQPLSPMLTHSSTHTLEAQHQRAQLFASSSSSTRSRSPRRPAKRAPRPKKQTATAKKSRPLPALSTLRREAPPRPGQNNLVAALRAHINAHGTKLKGKEFGSIAQLHKHCKQLGRVRFEELEPHDVVFFHNTHDANDDGRNNDWYTYAAVVEDAQNQTKSATLVDPTSPRKTIALSLAYPDMYTTEGGALLNTHVRQPKKRDLPYTRYLAGELFAGACRI